MSDISQWDPIADNNDDPPPDGAPEFHPSNQVNNIQREVMAAVRRQWEQSDWFDFGDVPTFLTASSFSIPGDRSADYQVGRRIWASQGVDPDAYGRIDSIASVNPTVVECTMDSQALTANLVTVALGMAVTGQPVPPEAIAEAVVTDIVFAAEKTTTQGIPPSGAVVTSWDSEYVDLGAGFDPATGVWTCPADGAYHLYAAGGLGGLADNDRVEVSLQVDGVTAAHARAYGGGASNQVVSHVACIRPLTAGQDVRLFMDHSSGLTPNMYTATPGSILIGGHKVAD